MEEKKQKTIGIQITGAKKIGFYERPISDFIFKEKFNPAKASFKIDMKMGILEELETIELVLKVDYKNIEQGQEYDLFGITSSHKYKVLDLKNVLKKNESGLYLVPDEVLASLLGISLSGTRGMLSLLITHDDYKDIVLPIINPTDLIKNAKKS